MSLRSERGRGLRSFATAASLVLAVAQPGLLVAGELERVRCAFGASISLPQEGADQTAGLLSGDFDGDGATDVAAVVAVVSPEQIPDPARVLMPFSVSQDEPRKVSAGQHAIAVVLSAGEVFLLVDLRRYSILDTNAATASHVLAWEKVSELPEKGLAEARGDVIVLPSEAGIDTYLFWGGSDWRFHEPLELP
jgi:hypothetical protein